MQVNVESLYICLEGGDGAGKDLQADMLIESLRLEGANPLRVHEPYEAHPHGKLLRELLKTGAYPSSHAALFLADRMALQETLVDPALEAGRPVVSVRSFLSTLVYQQRHWPLPWLVEIHKQMLVKPDVIIYLDVSAEVGLGRVNKRGEPLEFYEKKEIQIANRERYLSLLTGQHRNLLIPLAAPDVGIHVINADADPEAVQAEVWAAVYEKLVN